jgi:predicted methyltransferase
MEELVRKIPESSIDMIFTDSPYQAKYLSLYDELAQLAWRVLKSGGESGSNST